MTELDAERAAILDELQQKAAECEPRLAAALEVYNAAVAAAYNQLRATLIEYDDVERRADVLNINIDFDIQEFARKGPPGGDEERWRESEEGQRTQLWLDAWREVWDDEGAVDVPQTPRAALRNPPLSQVLAALPRRPGDVKPPDPPPPIRPIAPKVLSSVTASWRRIDAWLKENAPALLIQMNAGATPEAIAKAEATMGVELPEAVRASYLVHDGSAIIGLFPAGQYLSLEQMLYEVKMWRDLLADGGFDPPEGELPKIIQQVHFHPDWIPFAGLGSGDHTVIDLAPAEGGVIGQLVNFSHEDGPEGIGAPGLAEYLAYIADGMEAGAATVVEDECLDWTRSDPWVRSGYDPAFTASAPIASAPDRYFEFSDGTSNKFWEVTQAGSEMKTRWGKLGVKGQSKAKSFDSPERAATEVAKLIAQKVKEGYVEKGS